MAEERVQRKLAAILAADVVGFSRLMGENETGTLARLKLLRQELFDPRIGDNIRGHFPCTERPIQICKPRIATSGLRSIPIRGTVSGAWEQSTGKSRLTSNLWPWGTIGTFQFGDIPEGPPDEICP